MQRYLLAMGASLIAMTATAAHAQGSASVGQESDAGPQTGSIADIVVTAQRRSESLSTVPISVTAINGETLREARIQSLFDVALRTPNFSQTSQRKGSPGLFIRGIGSTEDAAGGDRSVGVFIDDVYIGRSGATSISFFDVERVEVLRGPQGTLYGRNVVGGALNVTTARPTFDFDYGGEATYGNYDLKEINGFVNVPFSAISALRVAVTHSDHDGYALNAFTGHRVDAENTTAGRASFRVTPADNFEILIRANVERTRDFGLPRAVSPCGPLVCLPRFNQPDFGNIPLETDPRRVQNQHDGFFHRDSWGTSLKMDWDTGIGKITSISAVQSNDVKQQAENGGVPDVLRFKSLTNLSEDAFQFSQELRLATPLADNLDWTLGAYYYDEEVTRHDNTDRCLSTNYRTPCAASSLDYAQKVKSQSLATYSELEFRPSEAFTIIVGARYTHDSKDANLAAINLGGPIPASASRQPFGPFDLSKSWNAFTPRVVVRYTIPQLGMIYATVSRGYKAGGYQGEANNAASIVVPYNPEHVTNYEVGSKLQFFDRHALLNFSAFIMKYDDLQVAQRFQTDPNDPTSIVNATANAAKATIKGFEGELTVRPFPFLELWGSGSYLHARYDEFLDGNGGDFTGNKLPRVPDYAFSVGGKASIPIGDLGDFELRSDLTYKGKFYFSSQNTDIPGTDPFEPVTLINATATFKPNRSPIEISVWAKNLTNKTYRSSVIPVSDFINTVWAPPRTYGVTVRFSQ